jgi:hypothetical protein
VSKLPRRPWEWLVLARVGMLLVAIRLLLPRTSLPKLLDRLTPRHRGVAHPRTVDKGVRFADALLAHHPIGARGDCLPRSLVLYHLAARAGMPVQLHCGVRRDAGRLAGHAWCTAGEVVLAGASSEGFSETYRYPATA